MSLSQTFKDIEQHEWIDIPKLWLQGRTIFGGLVAAIMMHKALCTIGDPAKKLLSASITFVGPVQETKARITAEILRQGKSVTTIEIRLWQDDAVQSILVASFGTHRASEIYVNNQKQAPDYPDVKQLEIMPKNILGPQCFQQFEFAWAEGEYPCMASQHPDFGGWFRFDPNLHENRDISAADLLALFDIWPPGVLPLFKVLAPASSLTWHITFVHPIQYQLHDWFKYKVVTDYAENGYSTEQAHIWDNQNQLIAISRQTVTVFA